MSALTAADILGAEDMKTEAVTCPEWGGDVLVKTMSGAERDAFETTMAPKGKKGNKKADLTNLRARYVAATAVDESGKALFTQAQIAALGKKSATALDRCFDTARRLNGMLEDDIEADKGN